MNRTPDIIAELRAEILSAPVAELPAICGQVAGLHAEALARIAMAASAPQTSDEKDYLLTAEELAKRVGRSARWVKDHRDKFPRVPLPGRALRFSGLRLDAMIRSRSYR